MPEREEARTAVSFNSLLEHRIFTRLRSSAALPLLLLRADARFLRDSRREERKRERAARADRLRLSLACSLYLKQRTGILSPRGFIFGRSFDACAAAARSEAKRDEAVRGGARRGEASYGEAAKLPACTRRVTKLKTLARFFQNRVILHSGDRLITAYYRASPVPLIMLLRCYCTINSTACSFIFLFLETKA